MGFEEKSEIFSGLFKKTPASHAIPFTIIVIYIQETRPVRCSSPTLFMTVNKVVFISAILPTVLSVLGFIHDPHMGLFIAFFLLLAFVIGLMLGMIICAIAKRPSKEPLFYMIAQLLVIATIVTSISISVAIDRNKARERQKYFGNIDANDDYVKYSVEDGYKDQVRTALNSLSGKYQPNEFQLRGHKIYIDDTLIQRRTEAKFIVHLRYRLNSGTDLKADVSVFRDMGTLMYYGRSLDSSDIRRIDSLTRKVVEDLKAGFEIAPDSIKKQMQKDFKEIFKKHN